MPRNWVLWNWVLGKKWTKVETFLSHQRQIISQKWRLKMIWRVFRRLSIVFIHDFDVPITKEALLFRLKIANVLWNCALANRRTNVRCLFLFPVYTHSRDFAVIDSHIHCLFQWTRLRAIFFPKTISRHINLLFEWDWTFVGNFASKQRNLTNVSFSQFRIGIHLR